jgi:hypothetical protein
MNAQSLIEELATRGIQLIPRPPKLIAVPAAKLTDKDCEAIRDHKAGLLALLVVRREQAETDRIARLDAERREADRWCGRNFAGVVPLCSATCFRLAAWVGWFDAQRLWARHNSKFVVQARADIQSNESEARKEITTMADRDFPNSGILFRNHRRREGSNDPDYQGLSISRADAADASRASSAAGSSRAATESF